jgi:hypothetical protein
MTNQVERGRREIQEDWEALFEQAIKQPGVAEVLKLYDAAELAYLAANVQLQPTEFITTSANTPLTRKA